VRKVYRRPFQQGPSKYQSTRANLDHITNNIAQQDDENSYPFVMNTVAQDPAMAEYHSIFDEAYMRDWHTKTSQWIRNISAELRLCCDCPSAPFVGELRPIGELKRDDEISDYSSCTACSKRWCMRCGIPVGPSYGNASNHSGPTFCKDTWAFKEAAREERDQGLLGLNHQFYPRCDAYTKARDEELHSECALCNTSFCFTCGLKNCECPGAESSGSGSGSSEEPAEESSPC
jgi:hypothetical protein